MSHWTIADLRKKKNLGSLFFPKEEILKVVNHSLEVLTEQMGFDTYSLILNANMSIYALAQILQFQNFLRGI